MSTPQSRSHDVVTPEIFNRPRLNHAETRPQRHLSSRMFGRIFPLGQMTAFNERVVERFGDQARTLSSPIIIYAGRNALSQIAIREDPRKTMMRFYVEQAEAEHTLPSRLPIQLKNFKLHVLPGNTLELLARASTITQTDGSEQLHNEREWARDFLKSINPELRLRQKPKPVAQPTAAPLPVISPKSSLAMPLSEIKKMSASHQIADVPMEQHHNPPSNGIPVCLLSLHTGLPPAKALDTLLPMTSSLPAEPLLSSVGLFYRGQVEQGFEIA